MVAVVGSNCVVDEDKKDDISCFAVCIVDGCVVDADSDNDNALFSNAVVVVVVIMGCSDIGVFADNFSTFAIEGG